MAVAIGLPWLAGILLGFFQQLLVWFSQYLSKRIVIIGAIIAAWGAAFAVLKALTIGAGFIVQNNLPPDMFQYAAQIIPTNFGTFVSHVFAVEAAVSVYKVSCRVLGYKASF